MKKLVRIVSVVFLLFFTLAIHAQETTMTKERPKVGLVLSGGGAKGAAHIGVLRYIEEVGIPIDYIAGTSMGSIIGGMYALGYTSGEILDIISHVEIEVDSVSDGDSWVLILLHSNNIPISGV